MNKFSSKNYKNNGVVGLKYHQKRSHNKDSCDEHIKALVRILAIEKAEEYYRKYEETRQLPNKTKGGT